MIISADLKKEATLWYIFGKSSLLIKWHLRSLSEICILVVKAQTVYGFEYLFKITLSILHKYVLWILATIEKNLLKSL